MGAPTSEVFSTANHELPTAVVIGLGDAGDLTPAKISQAIAATKNFAAVTGNISLNEQHDAVKSAVIIEYKDGKQAFKATVKP